MKLEVQLVLYPNKPSKGPGTTVKPTHNDWVFNRSHSGDLGCMALISTLELERGLIPAQDRQLGFDVEWRHTNRTPSEGERVRLLTRFLKLEPKIATEQAKSEATFYRCWSQWESSLKCMGGTVFNPIFPSHTGRLYSYDLAAFLLPHLTAPLSPKELSPLGCVLTTLFPIDRILLWKSIDRFALEREAPRLDQISGSTLVSRRGASHIDSIDIGKTLLLDGFNI